MKQNFYDILSSNDEFCLALGKVMLAASKLEVELKHYLRQNGIEVPEKKVTLGNLIGILQRNGHLSSNGEKHFKNINIQRNYLVHNLYASFVCEIENALLPVAELVPEDVEVYAEKAELVAANIEVYSTIVQTAMRQLGQNCDLPKNTTRLL